MHPPSHTNEGLDWRLPLLSAAALRSLPPQTLAVCWGQGVSKEDPCWLESPAFQPILSLEYRLTV